MKPVIGITANYEEDKLTLKREYSDSIRNAGGLPVILPYGFGPEDIPQLCRQFDGLLLTGGPDVDPGLYDEEPVRGLGRVAPVRDRLEIPLTQECLRRNKPIFAICRGHQVLNVAAGGSLYQDIPSQHVSRLQHTQLAPRDHLSHLVHVEEKSLLHRIAGSLKFKVNSFHHQAVKQAAQGFRVGASSGDGLAEAIESVQHPFALGVQWHPEDTAATEYISAKLFAAFVDAAKKYREVKEDEA